MQIYRSDSVSRKPGTPLSESTMYHRFNTPTLGGTAKITGDSTKKGYNSASKAIGIQQQTRSRDNSCDNKKRGENVIQMLAEERKRKREEKQRQAQIQREIKEKEKLELAEKKAKEREEHARRLLQEREEKLRLEKEDKLRRKLLREQKYKEEQMKKMEEAALKMQDIKKLDKYAEMKKTKDALIQSMKHQNKEISKEILLNMQKNYKQKLETSQSLKKPAYCFEMLQDGDSTDEEGKQSTRKKRPPPPEWSTCKFLKFVIAYYLNVFIVYFIS